jgi:NTE family protein
VPEPVNPTNDPTPEPGGPKPGIGLCLSGGGYRAMLFHLGALWRLNEFGLLPKMTQISSVSGGSIVAAYLGLRWMALEFPASGISNNFQNTIVSPIRELARHTIDVSSIAVGLLNPFSHIADKLRQAYADRLFKDATLQDLPAPPAPLFMINATNVQTAALWRFCKPFMGDFHVGLVKSPTVSLAQAVTASSAFPPFLSPIPLKMSAADFTRDNMADLQKPPYTTDVVLSDGGGYDNLGLETVFKHCDTVLVSDAGAKIAPEEAPHTDWPRHAYRMLNIIDNQVRSLRKRGLIAAYQDNTRKGAFWGIRTNILDYHLPSAMNEQCPQETTLQLADIPTRLEAMDDDVQERLINWGYAICDAAVRRHFAPTRADGSAFSPPEFPYKDRGV